VGNWRDAGNCVGSAGDRGNCPGHWVGNADRDPRRRDTVTERDTDRFEYPDRDRDEHIDGNPQPNSNT
jgi:hypothetical protein